MSKSYRLSQFRLRETIVGHKSMPCVPVFTSSIFYNQKIFKILAPAFVCDFEASKGVHFDTAKALDKVDVSFECQPVPMHSQCFRKGSALPLLMVKL